MLMALPGRVRMVKGPARVAVVDGACRVLGSDVSGRVVSVRPGKALPFEPAGRCWLRVRLGRGGRTWTASPRFAGISMWQQVAREIIALADEKEAAAVTVMLAGDSDTGKSTLCTFLANAALSRGRMPCVIDGDIGQGDLAPPAAIGAATLSGQVTDLRDARAGLFEFIGDISPVGLERVIAGKLRAILDRARAAGNADVFIVNTDGYVADGGATYKAMVADALQPDAIVCLGENAGLFAALRPGPWQALSAQSSAQAYKSRVERVDRRMDQFMRHVGSGSVAADLIEIEFIYADTVFSPADLLRPPIQQMLPENMKRMFVGLGSKEKGVVGFGIITSIDSGEVSVQTDVAHFTNVYLSNIRLARNNPAEIRIS